MVEMEYAFANDFVMALDAWETRFGSEATAWDSALRATIDARKTDAAAPASAA